MQKIKGLITMTSDPILEVTGYYFKNIQQEQLSKKLNRRKPNKRWK